MSEAHSMFDVNQVMQSVIDQTRAYFREELGLSITETTRHAGALNLLTLLDMTAIMGIGGEINLLVAFSFDYSQLEILYERLTADIEIQPEEVDTFREAVAGEIVNTILGHCTVDFPHDKELAVTLTPPIILEQVKHIRRVKNAMFYTQSFNTDAGRMDIHLVGPCDIFKPTLDYLK